MRDSGVDVAVEDGVLRITLNRPDRMNILGVETRKQILEAMKKHESDSGVDCVIISSEGKVFSAGADLNYLLTLDEKSARAYAKFVRTFLGYVEGYPKPTMGVVDGMAVGGGLELLMALDIVLASTEARFGQTELNVGLIPGGGGSQRLPRIVGARKAKEMIFTGRLISADEALEWGLVNKVVEPALLQEEAAKIVASIRTKSQDNLRLVKRVMEQGLSRGLEAGLELESDGYARVLASKEAKKSITEFLRGREAASKSRAKGRS